MHRHAGHVARGEQALDPRGRCAVLQPTCVDQHGIGGTRIRARELHERTGICTAGDRIARSGERRLQLGEPLGRGADQHALLGAALDTREEADHRLRSASPSRRCESLSRDEPARPRLGLADLAHDLRATRDRRSRRRRARTEKLTSSPGRSAIVGSHEHAARRNVERLGLDRAAHRRRGTPATPPETGCVASRRRRLDRDLRGARGRQQSGQLASRRVVELERRPRTSTRRSSWIARASSRPCRPRRAPARDGRRTTSAIST